MPALTAEQQAQIHRLLRGRTTMASTATNTTQDETMSFHPTTPLDAAMFEDELLMEGFDDLPTRDKKELIGEPIQILAVRHFDAKQNPRYLKEGQDPNELRTAYVARFVSLAGTSTGDEEQFYLPDKYGPKLTRLFAEHPGQPLNCRLFKDVTIHGRELKGWQLTGLDVIPDDKINKAVMSS